MYNSKCVKHLFSKGGKLGKKTLFKVKFFVTGKGLAIFKPENVFLPKKEI